MNSIRLNIAESGIIILCFLCGAESIRIDENILYFDGNIQKNKKEIKLTSRILVFPQSSLKDLLYQTSRA